MNSQNRTRNLFAFATVALAVFAGPTRAGALEGEIGILTSATLAGNNPATGAPWAPGDSYRFAFFTSATTNALSADISTYNGWVQGLANATTTYDIGVDQGVTWKAIGSTDAVDARDNTSTNPNVDGTGHAIFLLDGSTVVANDYSDLWDGSIQNIIDLTEQGTTSTYWPFTGTHWDGTSAPGHGASYGALGGGGQVHQGKSDSTTQWIWRQWTGEPSGNQLQMYALSDPLFIAGGLLTLQVNTSNGSTTLLGDADTAIDINFYEISSAAESLDDTNWSSLADQDFDGNGPPNGTGDGWEESGGAGAHALAEGYLLGDNTIGAGTSVSLGRGYDAGVDAQDLAFTYRAANGAILEGLIEYFSPLLGDADDDGDVDITDFNTLATHFDPGGVTAHVWAEGDFDGDRDIDISDFNLLASNFAPGGQDLAAIHVPEPTSLALLAIIGFSLLQRRIPSRRAHGA